MFENIIKFTLKHEGGARITKDPKDPGGTTKFGISQRAHPKLDIENLTEEQATEIYKTEYWKPVTRGIDDKLDMVAFDSAVNCGVGRIKRWLPHAEFWKDLIAMRRSHYDLMIKQNPSLSKYAKGWENRVRDLEKFIKET